MNILKEMLRCQGLAIINIILKQLINPTLNCTNLQQTGTKIMIDISVSHIKELFQCSSIKHTIQYLLFSESESLNEKFGGLGDVFYWHLEKHKLQ